MANIDEKIIKRQDVIEHSEQEDNYKPKDNMVWILPLFALLMISLMFTSIYLLITDYSKEFDKITNGKFDETVIVMDENDNVIDLSELNSYTDKKYVEYHGTLPSTAIRHFYFYDNNAQRLFTLTDLGANNLIAITMGKKQPLSEIWVVYEVDGGK